MSDHPLSDEPCSERLLPISQEYLRQIFNTYYLQKLDELRIEFLRDTQLHNPAAKGFPPGTRSQFARFWSRDGQRWLVEAHRYVFPNGESTRWDPKRVRYQCTIYIYRPSSLPSEDPE